MDAVASHTAAPPQGGAQDQTSVLRVCARLLTCDTWPVRQLYFDIMNTCMTVLCADFVAGLQRDVTGPLPGKGTCVLGRM